MDDNRFPNCSHADLSPFPTFILSYLFISFSVLGSGNLSSDEHNRPWDIRLILDAVFAEIIYATSNMQVLGGGHFG